MGVSFLTDYGSVSDAVLIEQVTELLITFLLQGHDLQDNTEGASAHEQTNEAHIYIYKKANTSSCCDRMRCFYWRARLCDHSEIKTSRFSFHLAAGTPGRRGRGRGGTADVAICNEKKNNVVHLP